MFKRNVIKTLLIKGEIARIWGPLFGPQNTKTALQMSVMPFSAVRGGFEPPVRLPVRQFSKLVV